MKRQLFETVRLQPYTLGEAIDREGFLSLVISQKASNPTFTVTHNDVKTGTFKPITDDRVIVGDPHVTSNGYTIACIDLIGLKQFVKIASSATGDAAIALGDGNEDPR